jgi:RHS repeat-associated protein
MPMPNRHTTDNNYRYAFQGQEKDPETDMEAFELRLWDGRIGRWLTVDPYHEFFSPYVGMGNNPINLIDPDGGMTDPPKNGKVGEKFNHPDHGTLTYNGNFWLDGSGQAILNEVVLTGQGKSNFLGSLARKGADFIPFVGSGLDIYEGIRDGDGWQVALGATFLVVDVFTLGGGSLVKGTVKTIGKEVAEEIVEETAKQSIKSLRRKAVREAWKKEKNLIETTGKGSRRWTAAEKKVILEKGKVKGYQGHHIFNVKHHPELAGNPANIEFVTAAEHLVRHGGNFKNKTTGTLIIR